ncbi:MAG: hypothetical protein DMG06_08145 [Acidobacteria bacterium]|nr:MAG: hypothetical protein DMG06_08145 [Acidobacteriota bacterium]
MSKEDTCLASDVLKLNGEGTGWRLLGRVLDLAARAKRQEQRTRKEHQRQGKKSHKFKRSRQEIMNHKDTKGTKNLEVNPKSKPQRGGSAEKDKN